MSRITAIKVGNLRREGREDVLAMLSPELAAEIRADLDRTLPLLSDEECNAAQQAQLAAVSPGWQPIETAPIGVDVLVCWSDQPRWRPRVLSNNGDGWENEDGHTYRTPGHWRYIDPPPAVSLRDPSSLQQQEKKDDTRVDEQ